MADTFPGAINPVGAGRGMRRGIGCMWNGDSVTVLLDPDSGDHCRAIIKLTNEAAEILAKQLLQCVGWNKEFTINTEPAPKTYTKTSAPNDRRCSCGDYVYGSNWACGPSGCSNIAG